MLRTGQGTDYGSAYQYTAAHWAQIHITPVFVNEKLLERIGRELVVDRIKAPDTTCWV